MPQITTPAPQEEVQKKQIGFITKGGGLNTEEWVKREKAARPEWELEAIDHPTHVEIYQIIRTKKK